MKKATADTTVTMRTRETAAIDGAGEDRTMTGVEAGQEVPGESRAVSEDDLGHITKTEKGHQVDTIVTIEVIHIESMTVEVEKETTVVSGERKIALETGEETMETGGMSDTVTMMIEDDSIDVNMRLIL